VSRSISSIAVITITMFALTCACERSGSNKDQHDADVASRTTSATTPARVGSCDRVASLGTCSEYSGAYLSQNEMMLTSTCGKLSGTFVYAECPNTSIVGACSLSTGEVRRFYASGNDPWDAPRAKRECEASFRGVWRDQK
jgi:hypothetical protein